MLGPETVRYRGLETVEDDAGPSDRLRRPRLAPYLLGALYLALLALGAFLGTVLPGLLGLEHHPLDTPAGRRILAGTLAVYALAAAIPFIPGAEIGMSLLAVFGARLALAVYLAMVAALLAAYAAGRFVPVEALARLCLALRQPRAAALVRRLSELGPEERRDYLGQRVRRPWLRALLRYRYVAFALVLNTPGNVIFGGGGGLALFAGMSRLFAPLPFLVTVLVAVAPVPLAVVLFGYGA